MQDTTIVSDEVRTQGRGGFISRLDAELHSAWRQRRWGSFLRAWITAIITTAAAGFVFPLFMIGIYTLITMIFARVENRGGPGLLSLCGSIAALAAFFTLIFTLPIMSLKASQDRA